MINWKVRLKNKVWWLAMVPATLLLVQTICALFGITLELGAVGGKIIDVINALFAVLAIVGVVNDPTTVGIQDSLRALTYEAPNDDREAL